jgi:hypothetical protein
LIACKHRREVNAQAHHHRRLFRGPRSSDRRLAAQPGEIDNPHGKSVNNTNANPNACWGQDRSFYASEGFFPNNMDIKQSFPASLGNVGDQRAAWVTTYCAPAV